MIFSLFTLIITISSIAAEHFLAIGGHHCEYIEAEEENTCYDLSSMEIISLENDANCPRISTYPVDITSGTAAFVDDKVMYCGGRTDAIESNSCFELSSIDDEWMPMASLPHTNWHMRLDHFIRH